LLAWDQRRQKKLIRTDREIALQSLDEKQRHLIAAAVEQQQRTTVAGPRRGHFVGLQSVDRGRFPAIESIQHHAQAVRANLMAQTGMFRANLDVVDDRRYENLTVDGLLALTEGSDLTFLFLVNRETLVQT
jgi:hypothetical protein